MINMKAIDQSLFKIWLLPVEWCRLWQVIQLSAIVQSWNWWMHNCFLCI